jgi:hypothetical protein
MSKKPAQRLPPKTPRRGRRPGPQGPSLKDMALDLALDPEAARTKLDEMQLPRERLRALWKKVNQNKGLVGDILEHAKARGLELGSQPRGRAGPTAGEERVYKAQCIKEGEPFLRLPLSTLGVGKGDHVRVRFDGRQIVVAPVDAEKDAPAEPANGTPGDTQIAPLPPVA